MNLSEIINISLCILSFVLAAISIVIVILTLRQNNKMIESTTRPYVVLYFEVFNYGEPTGAFILRNFGNSAAKITKFTFDDILSTSSQGSKLFNEQFNCIEGLFLAPNQKKIMPYNTSKLPLEKIEFYIEYKSSNKTYSESFILNPKNDIHIPHMRFFTNSNYDAVSVPLQDISERLL